MERVPKAPPGMAGARPPPALLLAIARRVSKRVKKPYLDHAELLYDKHGLPK